ncbi:hypothetical protein CRG98_009139 [Punica granatum]|uniref:Uncharacterized protein n=1 Tax=Punica granatum TaxID=22663 RepID=A0A2I0KPV1_PUNGR|nr:hypothetical protein CRG98_009139 [Punica granatum]
MISWALGFAGSGWCKARTSTFPQMSSKRKISLERGPFVAGMVPGKPKWIAQCDQGGPFSGSGSTRETKMNSKTQSESCFMVLVVLGCVQACFWVSFTCLWIGRHGSPVRKASANVRECPGLSRRLLKCAWRCYWSFWYQEGFLKSHIGHLSTLR